MFIYKEKNPKCILINIKYNCRQYEKFYLDSEFNNSKTTICYNYPKIQAI